ncbi:helix-turn-helix transcriptional regulator [Microbulbifer sp. SAOS-129_SWC]|uniref:helix-turn-helix domain-containing protein n=1 Tax=Microbulbifer sp. SAOS-129_SWC TaxID=3145235 RepID=UPI00321783AE
MTESTTKRQLGELMKLARLERQLPQSAVAEQLGIQQSYLSKVENDTALPSVDILRRLSGFYGLSTPRLLRQLDPAILRRNAAYRAHLTWALRRRQMIRAGVVAALVAVAFGASRLLLNRETVAPIHQPVTLQLENIDGARAIDLFAAYGHLEVRGRDLVAGKTVSIDVRDMPWDRAFVELADRLGMRAEFSGALVQLYPKAGAH